MYDVKIDALLRTHLLSFQRKPKPQAMEPKTSTLMMTGAVAGVGPLNEAQVIFKIDNFHEIRRSMKVFHFFAREVLLILYVDI